MTEVCYGVGTEPCLQRVTEERLTLRSANRDEGARLDIVAENFWGCDQQRAFFDVRVFKLTHSHRAIVTPLLPNAIAKMNSRREGLMMKE